MIKAYNGDIEKLIKNQLDTKLPIDDEIFRVAQLLLESYSNRDLIVFSEIIDDIPRLGVSYQKVVESETSLCIIFIKYFDSHSDEWTAIFSPETGWMLFSDIFTFIESTTDYLEQVIEMDDENPDSALLFRGQSDVTWELKPSIFRDDNILSENEFYNKIRLREPQEFEKDILDDIVKMQHYGLPTRLLDVSYNPLVALYFACNESGVNSHSVVCVFNEYLKSAYESDEVRILAHSVLVSRGWKTKSEYINSLKQKCKYTDGKDDLEIQAIIENNYFINACNHNERIKRQQGAFILFGMDFSKSELYKSVDASIRQRFVIMKDKKQQIMKELELLGVNEGFIFPELEHQTSYVKSKYKINERYMVPTSPTPKNVEVEPDDRTPDDKLAEYTDKLIALINTVSVKNKIDPTSITENLEFQEAISVIDWFNKESALATIRYILKKLFKQQIKDERKYKEAIDQFVGFLMVTKIINRKNEEAS